MSKRFLPNVNLPGCPSIEENAAGNKNYIEIYAGPDYAFRSLSDTGNSTYLQKRKESTNFNRHTVPAYVIPECSIIP